MIDPATLLSMAARRAWVGYRDNASQPTLMELVYDADALRGVGALVLSGMPKAALPQGEHVVVLTTRGVDIVGPACVR